MIFIMGLIIVGFISIIVFAWLDYREIRKFEKSEKVRWEDTEKLLEDSKKQREYIRLQKICVNTGKEFIYPCDTAECDQLCLRPNQLCGWCIFPSWTNRREKNIGEVCVNTGRPFIYPCSNAACNQLCLDPNKLCDWCFFDSLSNRREK